MHFYFAEIVWLAKLLESLSFQKKVRKCTQKKQWAFFKNSYCRLRPCLTSPLFLDFGWFCNEWTQIFLIPTTCSTVASLGDDVRVNPTRKIKMMSDKKINQTHDPSICLLYKEKQDQWVKLILYHVFHIPEKMLWLTCEVLAQDARNSSSICDVLSCSSYYHHCCLY